MNKLLAAAAHSEFLLFGEVQPSHKKKVLLARELGNRDSIVTGRLRLIHSPDDWSQYERERAAVEEAYGVTPTQVEAVVGHMRRSAARHPIRWHFYETEEVVVGAVGFFEYSTEGSFYCRLQDVDVFPRFRRHGHGNGLLSASLAHAQALGARALTVCADEDDWPLHWYVRHQFVPLATVPKALVAPFSHDDAC